MFEVAKDLLLGTTYLETPMNAKGTTQEFSGSKLVQISKETAATAGPCQYNSPKKV